MKDILLLKPERLITHPRNMRRFYPSEQVREMANSIAAAGGVLQPLIVTKAAGKLVKAGSIEPVRCGACGEAGHNKRSCTSAEDS